MKVPITLEIDFDDIEELRLGDSPVVWKPDGKHALLILFVSTDYDTGVVSVTGLRPTDAINLHAGELD